jgi:hypothetical protein
MDQGRQYPRRQRVPALTESQKKTRVDRHPSGQACEKYSRK